MKGKFFARFAAVFLLLGVVFSPPGVVGAENRARALSTQTGLVSGEYIVKFRRELDLQQVQEFVSGVGGKMVKKLLNPRTWLFRFDRNKHRSTILRRLRADRNVVYAERNGYVKAAFIPNDRFFGRQWNFKQIHVTRAWNKSKGKGVVVAVVDTGVAYENYFDGVVNYRRIGDLRKTKFVPGYDFVNNDTHPNDDNRHGSHVAGTIAQSTNNRRGVAGIAFKASIMPVKVLDAGGFGTFDDVADGVRWAADHGAHVINLSLGSSGSSSAMRDAVNYARNAKNVVVVAAAGNGGDSRLSYPAAYPSVISVAATDRNKTLTWYSQYGRGLDISAPGGDTGADSDHNGIVDGILQQTIYANNPGRAGYFHFQGTSMAAPHVSGTAALIRSRGITNAARITEALKLSATDLGAPGYDRRYGYGLVNAARAVRYRRLITPRIKRPKQGAVLTGGRRVKIVWKRRRAKKLRYQLTYTKNYNVVGTFKDGFESGGIRSDYAGAGNSRWFTTGESNAGGSRSAKSGGLSDSQSSELRLAKIFSRSAVVGFNYKVSSEAGYDYLDFFIDNKRRLHVSGESGWASASYPITAGEHTFSWVYSKDYSVSNGLDAGFIDNVLLSNINRSKWYKIVRRTRRGASSRRWRVPNAAGDNYKIRIRAYNGSYGKWSYSGRFAVR